MGIRVLMVIDHTASGGAQRLLEEIMDGLKNQVSFAVAVLGQAGSFSERYGSSGIQVFELGGRLARYNPLALYRLLRIARHWQPDILHLHLYKAYVYGPIVGNRLDCKTILHDHTGIYPESLSYLLPKAISFLYRSLFGYLLKYVNLVLVLTAGMRQAYRDNYGLGEESVRLMPNAVRVLAGRSPEGSAHDPSICQELGLNPGVKIITMIGRLEPEKDWKTFIHVAEQLQADASKSTAFLAVGNGSEEKRLRKYVTDRQISNVHFLGYREDVPAILEQSDIFLLTSRREPFGIVVLEAMAAGCPVIATNSGGPGEILTHGENGLVVPIGSIEKSVQAIEYLLNDAQKREAIIERARTKVRNEYSLTDYTKRLLRIYFELA